MALPQSGVQLVAQGYAQYIQQMRNIQQAHRQAFQGQSQQVRQFNTQTKQLAQSVGPRLSGAFSLATKAAGALGIALSALEFVRQAKAAADYAGQIEGLQIALDIAGQRAGYTTKELDSLVGGLKKAGADTETAQKAITTYARAGLDATKAINLYKAAQDLSVGTTYSAAGAFDRITEGVRKLEVEFLDEFGIAVKLNDVYKQYAAQLGKSADALTPMEQRQALLNAVLKEAQTVSGAYARSSKTLGGLQDRLAKETKDASEAFGRLLLPLRKLSVELAINTAQGFKNFAEGASQAGQILGIFSDAIRWNLGMLDEQQIALEQNQSAMYKFGQATSDIASKAFVGFVTAIEAGKKAFQGQGNFFDIFSQEFQSNMAGFQAKMAENAQAVQNARQQVGDFVPTQLDLADAVDNANDTLEKQYQLAKDVAGVMSQYEQDLTDAVNDFNQSINQAIVDNNTALTKAQANYTKAVDKLDQDSAKDRLKKIADFNKQQAQQQKDTNRQMLQEQERFNLQMTQAQRRFQVSDRRLRAEGDVLALMELREDYQLQQQEAKENYNLQQKQSQSNAKEQVKQAKQEFDLQLQEFDAGVQERKQALTDAYNEERQQLIDAYEQQKREIADAYTEQLQLAEDNRNRQLQELGASYQEQKDITQQGMTDIANEMAKLFGEDAIADSLITGWTDRAVSDIGKFLDSLQAKFKAVQETASTLSKSTKLMSSGGTGPTIGGNKGTNLAMPQAIGMAGGGEGVVTGPKHFFVEPGVKEYVKFVPQSRGGSMKHSGQINMGLNVSGMPSGLNEQLTQAIIDRAAGEVVGGLEIAINELKRRNNV